MTDLKNWAGNYTYSTTDLHRPASIDEIVDRVIKYDRIKVLGTRHCFNNIADSNDHLLSLDRLNKIIGLDTTGNTVTVEAGVRYGELATWLNERGYALHNLASLPHISIAGGCATATHGSGTGNGSLSTAVHALEIITASGELVLLSKEKDHLFPGAVVNLGGLGVVTKMTLAIEPAYQVRQYVYENLPLEQLRENFLSILSAGYSVSLFTDWRNKKFDEVWIKSRVGVDKDREGQPELFGATAATRDLHPIKGISAENCTAQMGVPGPWHERLPHFRMGFTPSSGEELQSEYFIPRDHSFAAIQAIEQLQDLISPHLLISEIRCIAADELWMSPCYRQASTAIHFTWQPDWPAVRKLLPLIEERLAPFGARPHWGKLFTLPHSGIAQRYEKLADFQQLLRQYDPAGKFRNKYLDEVIFGG
ncbi:MAG TPA: D-arabinono-1,4-lactone oxidase [Puia sp.]|jgi:xylitol oxidase